MSKFKSVSSANATNEERSQNFYKEYPKVLRLPGVLFGHLDRGRRLPSTPLIELAAPDVVEQLDIETEKAIRAAGEVLDRRFVAFLIAGRRGARIASRLAAIGIMSGRYKLKDIPLTFDGAEITPARLRRAIKDLKIFLESEEKKTASASTAAATEKSNATVCETGAADA